MGAFACHGIVSIELHVKPVYYKNHGIPTGLCGSLLFYGTKFQERRAQLDSEEMNAGNEVPLPSNSAFIMILDLVCNWDDVLDLIIV